MKNLFFWLTDREADALVTLALNPAGWPTFAQRTWQSLRAKGLVSNAQRPAPTISGAAAITLTRALRHVNVPSERALSKKATSARPDTTATNAPPGATAVS